MRMSKLDLIVTIVNRGFADDVMAAAKKAGASGGTILNGRGAGAHELNEHFGVQLHPEKELVLIIAKKELRGAIMSSIAKDAGLSRDGMGVCFSLPVDEAVGLAAFEEAD